eukprot:GDKJ01018604.1.p1 GENE.GDKJ01018604.1~~GDKJ01018604.1.p1  ORF type:complete len:908 (-),score=262.50 GDKJ01018604.1:80-2617(-)
MKPTVERDSLVHNSLLKNSETPRPQTAFKSPNFNHQPCLERDPSPSSSLSSNKNNNNSNTKHNPNNVENSNDKFSTKNSNNTASRNLTSDPFSRSHSPLPLLSKSPLLLPQKQPPPLTPSLSVRPDVLPLWPSANFQPFADPLLPPAPTTPSPQVVRNGSQQDRLSSSPTTLWETVSALTMNRPPSTPFKWSSINPLPVNNEIPHRQPVNLAMSDEQNNIHKNNKLSATNTTNNDIDNKTLKVLYRRDSIPSQPVTSSLPIKDTCLEKRKLPKAFLFGEEHTDLMKGKRQNEDTVESASFQQEEVAAHPQASPSRLGAKKLEADAELVVKGEESSSGLLPNNENLMKENLMKNISPPPLEQMSSSSFSSEYTKQQHRSRMPPHEQPNPDESSSFKHPSPQAQHQQQQSVQQRELLNMESNQHQPTQSINDYITLFISPPTPPPLISSLSSSPPSVSSHSSPRVSSLREHAFPVSVVSPSSDVPLPFLSSSSAAVVTSPLHSAQVSPFEELAKIKGTLGGDFGMPPPNLHAPLRTPRDEGLWDEDQVGEAGDDDFLSSYKSPVRQAHVRASLSVTHGQKPTSDFKVTTALLEPEESAKKGEKTISLETLNTCPNESPIEKKEIVVTEYSWEVSFTQLAVSNGLHIHSSKKDLCDAVDLIVSMPDLMIDMGCDEVQLRLWAVEIMKKIDGADVDTNVKFVEVGQPFIIETAQESLGQDLVCVCQEGDEVAQNYNQTESNVTQPETQLEKNNTLLLSPSLKETEEDVPSTTPIPSRESPKADARFPWLQDVLSMAEASGIPLRNVPLSVAEESFLMLSEMAPLLEAECGVSLHTLQEWWTQERSQRMS